MMPQIARGDLRVLAWIGDELAMQDRATFVSTKMADEQHDLVERFLAAYRKGAKDYHDAFIGPDERPQDGPGAADVIALIGKYTGQPPEAVKLGIAYVEPMLRLNVADVLRQIAWYKTQGMVKPEVDGATFIDKRYVVPLPELRCVLRLGASRSAQDEERCTSSLPHPELSGAKRSREDARPIATASARRGSRP